MTMIRQLPLVAVLLALAATTRAIDSSLRASLSSEWTTLKKEGDAVPHVPLLTRVRKDAKEYDESDWEWKTIQTGDLFKGKRIVVFSLPGAFTPTCSVTHLPGYQDNYDTMKQLGVDDVYCVSVNDAFVMRAWGEDLELDEDERVGAPGLGFAKVKLLPDGAATFTRAMGMSIMWDKERGFGERSWRYSMVVQDGKIEKLFVEQPVQQNSAADPFEVSDADSMIVYLKGSKGGKDEL